MYVQGTHCETAGDQQHGNNCTNTSTNWESYAIWCMALIFASDEWGLSIYNPCTNKLLGFCCLCEKWIRPFLQENHALLINLQRTVLILGLDHCSDSHLQHHSLDSFLKLLTGYLFSVILIYDKWIYMDTIYIHSNACLSIMSCIIGCRENHFNDFVQAEWIKVMQFTI